MRANPTPGMSRRHLLAAAAASLPAAAQAEAPAQASAAQPRDVGRKFNADGSPRSFAGNTVAGHLGQQGEDFEAFDAWLDIAREMPRHAFARKLALVPTSSWHVTLIGGANDADRQKASAWPTDLPRDMPIADIHRLFLQRLERRAAAPLGACDFVVDTERAPAARTEGTLGIPLRPADDATARRLGAARDELAELMRLRRPDHGDYRFHVTIGYLYRFLDAAESAAMQSATAGWMARLAARGPLTLRGFHFCVLRDMFAYRALRAV